MAIGGNNNNSSSPFEGYEKYFVNFKTKLVKDDDIPHFSFQNYWYDSNAERTKYGKKLTDTTISGFISGITTYKDQYQGREFDKIALLMFDPNVKDDEGNPNPQFYKVQTSLTLKGKEMLDKLMTLLSSGDFDYKSMVTLTFQLSKTKESDYTKPALGKDGKPIYSLNVYYKDKPVLPTYSRSDSEAEDYAAYQEAVDKCDDGYAKPVNQFWLSKIESFIAPKIREKYKAYLNTIGYDLVEESNDDGKTYYKHVQLSSVDQVENTDTQTTNEEASISGDDLPF